MKYSELATTRFVRDDVNIWTVSWWDEGDAFLYKLKRIDEPWKEAATTISKRDPDKLVVHPDSPILDSFEIEKAPSMEVLRELETARTKKFQMDYGFEFCQHACTQMRTLLNELFVGVVRSSLALGCDPEWLRTDISRLAALSKMANVDVDSLQDAVGEIDKAVKRLEQGLPVSVALTLKTTTPAPAEEKKAEEKQP